MKKKENLKNIALFEINNPKNLNSLDLEIIKEIDNFLNKVEKNNYRYVVRFFILLKLLILLLI